MSTDSAVLDHHVENEQNLWEGGKEPFKASYGKLMMWYFLLSDAFTFAGFLIAYGALRFSSPTWPVPDFVFSTAPFGIHHAPLIFVTIMSFLLILSSVTMVRAVQEGHRENKRGVAFWMFLTVLGGLGFLSCQAWEWTNLIATEHMSVTTNPFGTHTDAGVYLNDDGSKSDETFEPGQTYLIHKAGHGHGEEHAEGDHGETAHAATEPGDYAGYVVNEHGYKQRKYVVTGGENDGAVMAQAFGPKAFGALFFFITGFHGFHVFSGVMFLLIIMINVMSGVYVQRRNGYEMVEKIGLYWHFVDLVWVFVFLVFYLL
ncbi:MAG: cytochrome c oxidase subunit 3 [Saprospiraceae bacterium]|nr:cytochrome c oxidase subunit 3 [Saprospiraceae bacterium]